MFLPSNKKRSRRLCKKLHIGEFKEYGFEYEVTLKNNLKQDAEKVLIDRFLTELIEQRNLALGGSILGGFVTANKIGSVAESDRKVVEEWLRSNLQAESIYVSPLKDAWYDENVGKSPTKVDYSSKTLRQAAFREECKRLGLTPKEANEKASLFQGVDVSRLRVF